MVLLDGFDLLGAREGAVYHAKRSVPSDSRAF
jgi:hypothetical protein